MEQHQVKDIKNKIGCIFVVHPIIFICLGKLLYYCHDLRAGVHALEISKNGQIVNLWLFYPSESGNGKIGSIAVYGSYLQGHYNSMRFSMMAFGMPISDISIESGNETFIDIYLDY